MLRTALAAIALTLAITVVSPAAGAVSATGLDDPPPPPVTVNEFLPEDRDLSDCLSALPRPGCGSEARGGWRQWLVFGAIMAGVGVIGWRIAVGVRQNRRALDAPAPDAAAPDATVSSSEPPADRDRTPPSH